MALGGWLAVRIAKPRNKPRTSTLASIPVPTAGLISNRNLAIPMDGRSPPGAAILRNFMPTQSTLRLRRGLRRRATLLSGETIRSLFTYHSGQVEQLFAATDSGVWDVTNPSGMDSFIIGAGGNSGLGTELGEFLGVNGTEGLDRISGTTSGDWVTLQFSTAGGTFLIGVNGVDDGFIYDGTTFWPYVSGGILSIGITGATGTFEVGDEILGATSNATATVVRATSEFVYVRDISGDFASGEVIEGAISGVATVDQTPTVVAPGISGLDTARASYVWAYKNRIWFIERDTLNAWYLPVDQVGGTATVFPMGGIFPAGGTLLWGQSWSLDSSGDGGLSAQNVFVTTQGEVASYQGLSPESAETWSIVGVYQIGKPLGKKAWIRAGGDLIIGTSLGMIPLGRAIKTDYAGLGLIAISQPIADQWLEAVQDRGPDGWVCQLWGEGQAMLVSPPAPDFAEPVVFVSNSDSGAWTLFDGWNPRSTAVFGGRLFIGTRGGRILEAFVGGSDDGTPYTGVCLPLYSDLQAPGQRKIVKVGRVVKKSAFEVRESVAARFDWNTSIPAAPDAPSIPAASVWDAGVWDESVWNAERGTHVSETWHSIGGAGYAPSLVVQVTSGAPVPLDVEIIRLDFSYEVGDIVT